LTPCGSTGGQHHPVGIELELRHFARGEKSDLFKQRMGELGMTVPSDNTPEKYDAYLRAEMVRQGEIAKLTGAALQK
jgi:hypothetical protein